MCTLHDFLCSKIRYIQASTVNGLHSCSGKNTMRTPCVHLVLQFSITYIFIDNVLYEDYGTNYILQFITIPIYNVKTIHFLLQSPHTCTVEALVETKLALAVTI